MSAEPYVTFSVRNNVMNAIADPKSVLPRIFGDGFAEHQDHWKARAAIEVLMREFARDRIFAKAMEARRAETQSGSVHDSAVPERDLPK